MIDAAIKGEINTIVCLRLDRFMRDVVEGVYYCRKLQEAGCNLVLVRDAFLGQVDTSTPMGEFMLAVIFAVGQLERRLIIERTKEGIHKYKKKHGKWGREKRKDINIDLAAELLKVKSLAETAEILKVPRSTLRDHLARAGVEIPTRKGCRNTPPRKEQGNLNT
jgi:DNA invertase Pin-like site-specific DNA recombinase